MGKQQRQQAKRETAGAAVTIVSEPVRLPVSVRVLADPRQVYRLMTPMSGGFPQVADKAVLIIQPAGAVVRVFFEGGQCEELSVASVSLLYEPEKQ